jgi:hypothetical protein
LRVHRRRGIANGVVLVLVILVVAIPVSTYAIYFNKPITTPPTQTETSSTTSSTATNTTDLIADFETGATCGFGLTYGAPGGEGCFVTIINNGTTTATTTGACSLTYNGTTSPGTFAYTGNIIPGGSLQKITCGEYEGQPAGKGTLVTGIINLTGGGTITFNATAKA